MTGERLHLPPGPLGWTLAAFVIAAAPHLLALPPVIGGVVIAACGWRLLAAVRRWRPPPGWLRILLTFGAIALLFVSYGGLWGRRAATGLLCLMLAAKMLEMYRVRDLRLVASVSFFLVSTQFLFDERLAYIVYLGAGVLAASVALIRIQQFEQGHETAHDERRVLRDGVVLVAAAVPLALILFLTFPRLAEPLWGLPDEVMDGRTGLSDTMSPGSIVNLFTDSSPAFRAEFDGEPPPASRRYWRGPVLWRFDGDTWQRAFLPSRTPSAPVEPGPDDYRYTVQLEPHERSWLFALDYPVNAPEQAAVSLDFQIARRHPVTTLTEYRMRSNPDHVDMPRLPDRLRRLALELPDERNPRTREHAEELRRRFDDDRDLIGHVLEWFRNEAFFYSLETAPLGRHGADEFLFDLREGYCEYYASAFAILMRFADIPARVVTGYQGGFWQEGGDYLLVRNSDAHAWVEVWLEGEGWVRVDPTAAVSPERISDGARSAAGGGQGMSWLMSLRNRYDRLQHVWNTWVLGFDANRQDRMMSFLGLPGVSRTGMAVIMVAALGVAVALLALVWLRAPRRARDPVQRAWQILRARLQRRGLGPKTGETPLSWMERVRSALASPAEFEALVTSYCRLHYGELDDQALRDDFIERARSFRVFRAEPSSPQAV